MFCWFTDMWEVSDIFYWRPIGTSVNVLCQGWSATKWMPDTPLWGRWLHCSHCWSHWFGCQCFYIQSWCLYFFIFPVSCSELNCYMLHRLGVFLKCWDHFMNRQRSLHRRWQWLCVTFPVLHSSIFFPPFSNLVWIHAQALRHIRQIAQETSGEVQYSGGRQPAVLRALSQRLCR